MTTSQPEPAQPDGAEPAEKSAEQTIGPHGQAVRAVFRTALVRHYRGAIRPHGHTAPERTAPVDAADQSKITSYLEMTTRSCPSQAIWQKSMKAAGTRARLGDCRTQGVWPSQRRGGGCRDWRVMHGLL